MKPILLELGPLRVHAYGLALAISFLVGGMWVTRRARPLGYREEDLSRLFLWILGSALVGSRVYYALQHPEDFRGDWLEVLAVWRGGLTQYGGVIAALVTGGLFMRAQRWSFRLTSDLIAPALALGEGITRIGCFLNGCCFGRATDLSWGVHYPGDSAAHWTVGDAAVHPTQIYLSLGNLVLAAALARLRPPWLGSGRVLALYLVASSALRFAVDATRYYAETDYFAILGLRLAHSQWIGLFLAALGLLLWFRPRRLAA